jgi:hypothetical protein
MAVLYLTRENKVEITSTLKLSTYHAMSFTSDRSHQYWLKSTDFFLKRIIPWPLNCSPRSFHLKKQDEWDDFVQTIPKAGFTTGQLCHAIPTLESIQSEALWLTPTVTAIGTRSDESLAKRTEYRESIGRSSVPPGCLAEQVAISGEKPIQDMRQTWPTPDLNCSLPTEERTQGQLNPDWIEWLMGFPTLWSVADPKFI